jgi:hypothetical protein
MKSRIINHHNGRVLNRGRRKKKRQKKNVYECVPVIKVMERGLPPLPILPSLPDVKQPDSPSNIKIDITSETTSSLSSIRNTSTRGIEEEQLSRGADVMQLDNHLKPDRVVERIITPITRSIDRSCSSGSCSDNEVPLMSNTRAPRHGLTVEEQFVAAKKTLPPPTPLFVVLTERLETKRKVYINVCTLMGVDLVSTYRATDGILMNGHQPTELMDKYGIECTVYDILINCTPSNNSSSVASSSEDNESLGVASCYENYRKSELRMPRVS